MSPTDSDLPPPKAHQKTRRACLRCRRQFTSAGWNNRLCSKCRARTPRIDEWPEIIPMTVDEIVEMDKPITPEVSK